MTDLLLDAALEYAARGWPVFPLEGKEPITSSGVKDATTDEGKIREWWKAHPRANIGLACGEASAVVVDDDGPLSKPAIAEYARVHGIETADEDLSTVRAGTAKGEHLYFGWSEGCEKLKNWTKPIPDTDIRTTGGYVVAPPSIHPDTGEPYTWIISPDNGNLRPFPSWLVDLLLEAKAKKRTEKLEKITTAANKQKVARLRDDGANPYGKAALEYEIATLRATSEGERNNTLNTAALKLFSLVKGGVLDRGEAERELTRVARSLGLKDPEITKTLESAWGAATAREVPDDGPKTEEPTARELLEILEEKLVEDPDGWAQDPDVKRLLASYRRRDAVGAEALLKRAGVRGDLKKALMTDLKRIDSDEKARQRRATAAKSRTTEEDEDEGFSLLDFCFLTDEGKYAFSPTTATKSIIAKSKLAMTATETDIYRFDGQIYRPDGDRKIDLTLCRVAKDHVLGKNVQEVVRRVKNELLEDPVEFDCNPYLLGVRNGVVDLRTGEFRDYLPEDLITYQIDVTYDPAARCPRYVQFLEEIQPNVTDRLTLVDWFPATAIRKPLPYVLFLLGLGRNGKGIYERLIKRFFGSSAFRDMALSEVTKNNFAAGNFYKKLGWIATEQSGKKKATIGTDFIKLVTGFGSIDADRKNLSRIQFEAYFQTIVDTNAMPKIEDTSIGWMERFCKQDLPYVFVSNPDPKNPLEKKKDPHLFSKLTTDEELSGILNLLIWRAKETCETEAITKRPASELFNEYAKQSASVSTFCDLFLEYEEGLTEPNIPTVDIYEAYKKWCSYLVGEVVDEGYFGRYLRRLCNSRQPSRPRRGTQRLTAYPGLLFHEDKVTIAIEALSKGWTGMDGHGQVVDEKDFSKTDNKSTSGTSGQVELWNQVVKRFGPCRPEVQEDKKEDFLSKGEIHQNTRPTRPLVPPITGDPKNGKSTRPLPVHTSPLPVQDEDHDHHGDEDEKGEGGELAGDSEPSESEDDAPKTGKIDRPTPAAKAKGRRLDRLNPALSSKPKLSGLTYSKGKAEEYSPISLNLYGKCSHGCGYCYNTSKNYNERIGKSTLAAIERDIKALEASGERCPVHISFIGDPYDLGRDEDDVRAVLELFHKSKVNFQILTKGGTKAVKDFDLYRPGDRFGCTLTFLDPKKAKTWEPGAALPDDRLRALKEAHDETGLTTWASLEPIIDWEETKELIRRAAPFVDVFAVGKLNADPTHPDYAKLKALENSIDWRKVAVEAVELLESLGATYYVKDDLKRYLPERDRTKKAVERSTAKNDPPEENGRIFKLSQAYWRDLARQHNGLNTRVLKSELGYDDLKAGMCLDLLRKSGWIEDYLGRLQPPGYSDDEEEGGA